MIYLNMAIDPHYKYNNAKYGIDYISRLGSFVVQTVDTWKRRIVRHFVFRSYGERSYRILKESTLFEHFAGNFETNAQAAYEQLLQDGIIEKQVVGSKTFYGLDFVHKSNEIESLVKGDPVEETAGMMRPSDNEIKDLDEVFRDHTRGPSNMGHYYFYTKKSDSDYWVVMVKSKPNARPSKIIMGSLADENSRIMKIWRAAVKVSEVNRGSPFIRKWVENVDQQACGNNRQPSRAAFKIFEYIGWLEVSHIKGRIAYYRLAKGTVG